MKEFHDLGVQESMVKIRDLPGSKDAIKLRMQDKKDLEKLEKLCELKKEIPENIRQEVRMSYLQNFMK